MHNEKTAKEAPPRNVLRRLYDWVLCWADHPAATPALFIVAFAEASFFPIPPDILLLAMAVGCPQKALRFAAVCTAGSVLGSIAGYLMGWGLWATLAPLFYQHIPGFDPGEFERLSGLLAEHTFSTIFTAGFTPIPFKVFTLAAGAALAPLIVFIVAATLSRGLRFFLLAGLIMHFGPAAKHWIDRHFNTLTIIITLLLLASMLWVNNG